MILIRYKLRVGLTGLMLVAATALSADNHQGNSGVFRSHDGYEKANFGAREVIIKTRAGQKSLRVTLSNLRLTDSGKNTAIKLPGAGIALLQHLAGDATIQADAEKFEPMEGEWLRLALPSDFRIGVGKDTVLLDLILIEEQ
ncbi:hypothetical protein [Methylobacter sp.]|uniref:hypothetical protein n=1 Tax=Methylobacter sp. TaxID=2051955 RepID=UPI003DA69B72